MADKGLFLGVLAAYCRQRGHPEPVDEHTFHPIRLWRFDYAWPALRLALEVEGGTTQLGGGRHNRAKGYEEDCRKYSTAAATGWRVLRCTWSMVNKGEVWGLLDLALAHAQNPVGAHDARRSPGADDDDTEVRGPGPHR